MYDAETCLLHHSVATKSPKWLEVLSKFRKKLYQSENFEVAREGICAFLTLIVFFSLAHWILTKEFEVPAKPENNRTFQIDTMNMKPHTPVIMWYSKELVVFPEETNGRLICSNTTATFECDIRFPSSDRADAYIFYATLIDKYPLPRDMNTLWGLVHEESPRNRLELMYESVLNLFNYSSTYSRYSDVPMPLMWMRSLDYIVDKKYFVNTKEKNAQLSRLAPVFFMQSDCDTSTEREAYVEALMKHIPIDSYGLCLRNKELPLDPALGTTPEREYLHLLEDDALLRYLSRYKFIIAIENGVCNDYITEKFWRSIYIGVVPIYYGSPQIRDFLPNNKSAILLEDFPTPELLSRHLHYLLRNDTAYEEYLEHKTLGKISNDFLIDEAMLRPHQMNFVESVVKLECLMCERLHDRDSTRVNIVTRKHLDCPVPTSALTLSVNPENRWIERIAETKALVDDMVKGLKVTKVTRGIERHDFLYTPDVDFPHLTDINPDKLQLYADTETTGLKQSSYNSDLQLYTNITGSRHLSNNSLVQQFKNLTGLQYSGFRQYSNHGSDRFNFRF